jgi:hypothetical protein
MEIAGTVMLVLGLMGHETPTAVSIGPGQLRLAASPAMQGATYEVRF